MYFQILEGWVWLDPRYVYLQLPQSFSVLLASGVSYLQSSYPVLVLLAYFHVIWVSCCAIAKEKVESEPRFDTPSL